MPIYPYKCKKDPQHVFERHYAYGKYPLEHECVYEGCDGECYRIITPIHFSVDNVDKANMSFAFGREFSNKRELNEYMSANGYRHLEDSEWAADREWLQQQTELKQELAGRGIDYGEWLAEQNAAKKSAAQERLKNLGLNVQPVQSAEYEQMLNAETWQDTVEDDYVDRSSPVYNKKGEHIGYRGKAASPKQQFAIKEKYRDVVEKKNYTPYVGASEPI